MDTETIEAIDGLRGDLHQVEARLTARLDGLDGRVDRLEEGLGPRFEATRRHFDVVAESLRDDIRMIAEGLVTLSAKVDTLRR